MRLKRLSIFTILLIYCLVILGCSKKDTPSKDIVLTINDVEISLDEAKFYAYNKQANYEVYYLASGAEINWDEPYYDDMEDVSLEDLVKAEVMDQMKENILLSEHAKDKGIRLFDEDKKDIEASVEQFISDSKDTLLDKIGKDKEIFYTIYTRQMYVDKLYRELAISDNTDAQDSLYKDLLNDAEFDVNEKLWNTITFDDAIYTSDDVKEMKDSE